MKKNNQKILIVLIIVLLIFTSIFAIFISLNQNEKEPINVDNDNSDNSKEPVINRKISRLIDFDEFNTVQNAINDFYSIRINENKKELLSLMNEEFINQNNITEENVLNFITVENENASYQAEEIYYNDNSSITYYFIKGFLIEYPFADGDIIYKKDIYYLLILDNNKRYTIMPLNKIDNLEEYANNYVLKNIVIDNNTKFSINKVSENSKLITYINMFTNYMFLDTNKAYNLLDIKTKEKYSSLSNFESELDTIHDKLFTKFWITSSKENEDSIVYKVQDKNNNTITITEYYPNDFKIGFEFVNNIE